MKVEEKKHMKILIIHNYKQKQLKIQQKQK